MRLLDSDGSGVVERNLTEDDISPHRWNGLTRTFHKTSAGEITIGEFKRKLDALKFGFLGR